MLFKNISYVDEHLNVQKGQHMLIEANKIKYLGSQLPDAHGHDVIDGNNKLVAPGFYNAHCHIPMTLLRGYGEGLPLQRWLEERMFPYEAKMDRDAIYWASMLGALEMIKSGVVSFTDMYFTLDAIIQAVKETGLKANLSHGLSGSHTQHSFDQLTGVLDTKRLLEVVSTDDDKIIIDASLHAEYTSDQDTVSLTAAFAKKHNLRMHTHISETRFEHENCKKKHGLTPTAYLEKHGLLDQPTTAAHCVWAEEEDLEIFREKNVSVVHCISSNLKLGSGFAPIKKMHEKGVRVCIGTDGAAANNNLNMLEEIHLAALCNKGIHHDSSFLSPQEIVKMGSLNGAISQGRTDCGLIKEGYRADLIVVDMDKPHLQLLHDPLANLVFSAQSDDICMTVIDGRIVYNQGEYTGVDQEKVIFEANRCNEKILASLS